MICILFLLPVSPKGIPGPDFDWSVVNYAPMTVCGALILFGGWYLSRPASGSPARSVRRAPRRSSRTSSSGWRTDADPARECSPWSSSPPRRGRLDRHRAGRVHRHAGAACRASAAPPPYFLDEVVAARRRGVQLPARRRRRDEHRRRLRDVELGARLRRLRAAARHGDAAPGALARGHRAGAVRRASGPTARRSSPRRGRSCKRQLDRLAERGLVADVGTELEFMLFADSFDTAWRRTTATWSRPTSTTSTTRCSAPPGSSRCCGASATGWPAPGWSSSRPRASATSASTRSPSATPTRSPPATTTRSTRPAPRRSPTRPGWR